MSDDKTDEFAEKAKKDFDNFDKEFRLLNELNNISRLGSMQVGILYDRAFEAHSWIQKLPYLKFPSHWEVKIIPAFCGAVIRFLVRDERLSENGDRISIYFDGYNNLGYCRNPYWEVYPASDGDTARFYLGEEAAMLAEIEKAIGWLSENAAEFDKGRNFKDLIDNFKGKDSDGKDLPAEE